MVAHLDTRKERPLTSREICKILSASICGAVQAGAEPDAVLEFVRSMQDTLLERPVVDHGHLSAIPSPDPAWCGALGGLMGGLLGGSSEWWCHPKDISTAIDWICEHWGTLMATVAETRAMLGMGGGASA